MNPIDESTEENKEPITKRTEGGLEDWALALGNLWSGVLIFSLSTDVLFSQKIVERANEIIGSLSKLRRRRQRERHKTIGFN